MFEKSFSTLRAPTKISYAEFYHAFTRENQPTLRAQLSKGGHMGVAVSGGVDSMALAQLCSGLMNYKPAKTQGDLRFKAFIIDHNAREGSASEAQIVHDRLHSMGLWPSVIRLTWPLGVKPLDLPDFETQARTLRYRALGIACRDLCIDTILFGHHQDDQAETVLMRLACGHRGKALTGMSSYGEIPECWGIHGVHRSGYFESIASDLGRPQSQQRHHSSTPGIEPLGRTLDLDRIFEAGGVKVLRPLLDFGKDRLVETCRAHSVQWIEDETNKDPRMTPRNAIRELLQTSKLPTALRKDSMLRLAQRKVDRAAQNASMSGKLFAKCEILLFEVRSGGLVIRLPEKILDLIRSESRAEVHQKRAHRTAALLLRRVLDMVAPQNEIALASLEFAVLSIFPDLRVLGDDSSKDAQCNGLTAGGVRFQRLAWPSNSKRPQPSPVTCEVPRPDSDALDPNFVWKLTRQPYSAKSPTLTILPASGGSDIAVSDARPPQTYVGSTASPWSPWQLWDGRYWIRLLNFSSQILMVRALDPSDIRSIGVSIALDKRKKTSPHRWQNFRNLLADAAPGEVRWTLPIISERPNDDQRLGKVLVLPTLGRNGIIDILNRKNKRKVDWEIRYKNIGWGNAYDDDKNFIHKNRDRIISWKGRS